MAQLIVRGLSDELKERLKARAKRHGNSLEAEVREILTMASEAVELPPSTQGLGTTLADEMRAIPLEEGVWEEFNQILEEARRERLRQPPETGLFDE